MKKILLFMVAALLVFSLVSCDQEVKTKTYKVAYNANGAAGSVPAAIEVEEGRTITVPSCGSLSMKGYDFVGWNTKKDGSGRAYKESQSVKVDSDIALYAQWSIHEYSISYELDGGSYPEDRSNPTTYTIETETFILNNPEKDGYEFLGWTTSENEEPNKNVSIDKGTIGDLLFITVWRPLKSYSISYDVNGGEGSIGTVLKLEGESAEIATASEVLRNGYGFACWNTESDGTGKDYNPGDLYEEDSDLQLYAKWSIVKYSIEYALNDGKLATGKNNPTEYTIETSDIVLENPTKYGYEFVGWRYKDDSDALASTNFSIKRGTTGNLSIVAVWKALGTYTISYDANGGTGTIETQSEYKGTSLTISSSEDVERVGYTFFCWNTEKDGTGKDYKPNDTYSADTDLRLYAKWNPVKYSIKYDLEGGTFSDGSSITEYTIETDTFTLPIPTKAEYGFIGWKAKVSDEAQKTVSIEKGSTGNLSFTAVWRKLNRYTVSYDANGGSGSIESQSKLEGSSITISDADGIERAGYTFVCWNTKSDGSGTDYKPNYEYTNDADLVLYAKWNPIKYSITYDLAGGTLPEGKSNPSDYTIETELFTLVNPKRTGFVFLGWKESGAEDETPENIVSIANGSTGNRSLIAVWRQANEFTVIFDANGADGGTVPSQLIVYEGDSFSIPSCDSLYKDDYAFYGWNTKSDGTGSLHKPSESIEINGDVVLYAYWKESPLVYTYLYSSESYSVKCNDKDVVSIVIPSIYKGKKVTALEKSAFDSCSCLSNVTIPEGITSIGDYSFRDCSGLTSIMLPVSLENIGSRAFLNSGLTGITIPKDVMSIGDSAFQGCKGLSYIKVAISNFVYYSSGNCLVEKSSNKLLFGCKNSIIPDSVTSIEDKAFYGCSGLTSITIPDGVTSIGDSAFNGCSGLTSITISVGVTSIGDNAFSGCSGLTSITIPDGVTSIGTAAFSGCSGLMEISIPSSVKNFGHNLFERCEKLSVVFSKGVTKIPGSDSSGYSWSYGCRGIVSVTMPEGVTSIGDKAFYGCSGLTSITIPNSVTSIGSGAFGSCYLESIEVNEGNNNYYIDGNCLVEKKTKKLVFGCKDCVIPADIKSIGDYAFSGCSGLTSIAIPSSVTSIGKCAFEGCRGLTSITIPDGVTSIGDYSFRYCYKLASIAIPNGVTSIGSSAFSDCSGLTSITIPNSAKSIGSSAFEGCRGLIDINYSGSISQWNSIKKGYYWNWSTGKYTIHCTDGDIN